MKIMEMDIDKRLTWLPLLVGVAALLFGSGVAARTMGWLPSTAEARGDTAAVTPLAGNAPAERRCAECGVIVSKRKGPGETYQFKVRLPDGSHRIITDANGLAWQLRERVIIIDGAPASTASESS